MSLRLRTGKLPFDPNKPKLHLSARLAAQLPVPPTKRDWISGVSSYPMYGNDAYGDCVWAEIGHEIQARTFYAQGTAQTVSKAAVLKGYSDVTGFDPTDPSTDQGTVMQDAMNYWRKTGVGGHKILAFASVDIYNKAERDAALNLFGALAIGFNFPDVAMNQFNSGQAWDVVPNDGGIEGGHAVHLGYYDSNANMLKVTTWGAIQGMTEAFWDKYVDEAWVVITQDWLDANGRNPEGIDLYGLGEDFSTLTGQPNPFPAPTPVPVPPAPTPVAPSAVDVALWNAVKVWVPKRHTYTTTPIAAALKIWAKAKGLV